MMPARGWLRSAGAKTSQPWTCLQARFAGSRLLRQTGFRLRKKEVNLQLADKESKEASYQDDLPFVLFESWP